MRLILILYALLGAALAQKDSKQTKEFCETRMSRTVVSDTTKYTHTTKVKFTASKPFCDRTRRHPTFTVKQDPVTSTVLTRSIRTVSVTAPQKLKTLTVTKTITETAVTTPTFLKTDSTVYTTTSTLTSTVTVPTVSGFIPLASVSGFVSRKRSQSNRSFLKKHVLGDITHVSPFRVFPRKAKPKDKPKADITRGWLTTTVTEADTTMTADDTATTTSTLTKATTTKTFTETETVTRTDIAPAESSWAACNSENLINAANGGHGINAVNIGKNVYYVHPLITPYDCCVECQKRSNCIFSVAYHPHCYLVIGTACLAGHTFDTSFTTLKRLLPENGATLSNGPCGHIVNAGEIG
ncbi:hypothetical protein FPANT_1162 [Fusarium pseudoanthophilum]|uniref:Apple domain-containing protein n=1 Tax=Fusarium pseudoanthophilum TaxID=48495 RepID=A0A8H5Q018_9HYPO|nr:hypothetical protein FPANT_1162 [Fusarium pseudoanthophilum]